MSKQWTMARTEQQGLHDFERSGGCRPWHSVSLLVHGYATMLMSFGTWDALGLQGPI